MRVEAIIGSSRTVGVFSGEKTDIFVSITLAVAVFFATGESIHSYDSSSSIITKYMMKMMLILLE
jgi:hypothetical protein